MVISVCAWAVLYFTWAVLVIQNGPIDLDFPWPFLTFLWAVLVLGRFGHFPFVGWC